MPQSIEEHSGARIARIRKQRGLTQQGLAIRAHVSKSLLSKVECGQKPASPALIAACARALGASTSELLGQPYAEELRRDRMNTLIQPIREGLENWDVALGWETALVACLQREVAAHESHGDEARIRSARFPAIKTIEDLDVTHLRGMTRQQLAHLGTLDFITGKENAVFLGPPGTGKTHLSIDIAVRACQAGHRVAFATATQWVDRLAAAHHAGHLQAELIKLSRYPLIGVDEVGYIPFEAEAANLFFHRPRTDANTHPSSSRATNPSDAGARSSATRP